MVKLPFGFSPKNAAIQLGSMLNPTGGVTDTDIFSDRVAPGGVRTTGGSSTPDMSTNDVYWIGQDGNVYVNGKNMGKDLGGGNATGYVAAGGSGIARYIDDPNPGGGGGGNVTGGGGGMSDVQRALNTAGINIANAKLAELDALMADALAADEARYRNARGLYDQQETEQRKRFDEGITRNTQNYDANLMASLRAGAGGIQGLMQMLRGAGGTAVERARDAVRDVTAEDIRSGYEVNRENTEELQTNLSNFLTELQRKRLEADDMRVNNERATRANFDNQRQQLFQDLAGYYGAVGDTARVNDYAGRIAALQPSIAQNSRAQVSDYSTLTPVEVTTPEISAFKGASNPDIVAPGNTPGRLGTGIFTADPQRRRREQLMAA